MIVKFKMVQGQVEIIDYEKNYRQPALNNSTLSTSGKYHYEVVTHVNSYTIIRVNNNKVNLAPDSVLTICNIPGKIKNRRNTIRLFIGKVWDKMVVLLGGKDKEWESGETATVGVRG